MASSRFTSAAATVVALTAALALVSCGSNSSSGGGDDLFAGKTITFVSPFPPGGQADIRARLAAENFAKFAPGKPRVVVRNQAGGGGAVAMKDVLENKDPDGTTIVVPTVGVLLRWLLKEAGHDYPLDDAKLVGSMPGSNLFVVRSDKATTVDELLESKEKWAVGDNAPNSAPGLGNELAAKLLGIDIDHVFGFEGEGPLALAVERGEVDVVAVGDAAWRQTYKPLGKVTPIFQWGILDADGVTTPSKLLADTHTKTLEEVLVDLKGEPPTGPTWEAFQAIIGLQALDTPLIVHPDTSEETLEALRSAWAAMVADDSWAELSQERLGAIQPTIPGDEAAAVMKRALKPSDAARNELLEVSGG
jgi:hypothetical protein